MVFLDYYPNAERTLTTVESMMITKKEYRILKEMSSLVRKYFEENLQMPLDLGGFLRYYVEYTILKSKHKDIKPLAKEIIIANVVLPDDIKVAELLNKNGFSIQDLRAIMRVRSYIKNIILNDADFDKEMENILIDYKEKVNTIIEIFISEFNVDNQNIILNRICEMLETCPTLFVDRVTSHTQKR